MLDLMEILPWIGFKRAGYVATGLFGYQQSRALQQCMRVENPGQGYKSEAKLADLRVGRAKIAGALHLLEKTAGDKRAGFIVLCEQVQSLPLPAPVLHDLRRKLHEIPGYVRARQAADFHLA